MSLRPSDCESIAIQAVLEASKLVDRFDGVSDREPKCSSSSLSFDRKSGQVIGKVVVIEDHVATNRCGIEATATGHKISGATAHRARHEDDRRFPGVMGTKPALNFVCTKSARLIVIDNRIHLKASRTRTVADLVVDN